MLSIRVGIRLNLSPSLRLSSAEKYPLSTTTLAVVGSGYSQDDVKEEVQMMLEGGSWVDFNDGRTT